MAGTYRLRNIRLKGNEHGKLRANTIYAELAHENGSLAIAATLEHILKTIRNKKLAVDSVTISWEPRRDTYCSEVHLTKYPTHKRGK